MTLKVGEKYWGTFAGESQWLIIHKIMKLEDGRVLVKFRAPHVAWLPWFGPIASDFAPQFVERLRGGAVVKTIAEIEVRYR